MVKKIDLTPIKIYVLNCRCGLSLTRQKPNWQVLEEAYAHRKDCRDPEMIIEEWGTILRPETLSDEPFLERVYKLY